VGVEPGGEEWVYVLEAEVVDRDEGETGWEYFEGEKGEFEGFLVAKPY
jgi:hypothetical protein